MNQSQLNSVACAMVVAGKGILAMDESHPTCAKRFKQLGIADSEDNRRSYRSLLVTAPRLNEDIAAAILFDETIRQETTSGVPFPDYLSSKNIIPGIKVDTGAKALANHRGEKVTEGLDGLRERLSGYYDLGARFAKWRAVITIDGETLPSTACMHANAHALARYAALCQEAMLVPIVEPEVLMDGEHSIERCLAVSVATQQQVFTELQMQGVDLSGIILKPNMVVSGKECEQQADSDKVARMTLDCLRQTVPAEVPGIAFLSGGLSDDDATAHLSAINRLAYAEGGAPWRISFSYGRALQQAAMKIWNGQSDNIAAAQQALLQRAQANAAATLSR